MAAQGAGSDSRTFRILHLTGSQPRAEVPHPVDAGATATWNAAEGHLTVSLPRSNTAVLVRLGTAAAGRGHAEPEG
jgi:alpha-galactosidase